MNKPLSPCHKCEERWVDKSTTCHSVCEKYAKFVQLNEEYRAWLAGQKELYTGTQWYQTCTGYWRKK